LPDAYGSLAASSSKNMLLASVAKATDEGTKLTKAGSEDLNCGC